LQRLSNQIRAILQTRTKEYSYGGFLSTEKIANQQCSCLFLESAVEL